MAGGKGLCQGRALCAAKRSESLDTSRAPAMLLRSGNRPLGLYAPVRNIFDIFLLPQVPFIDRGQNFARIYGTTSLKRGAVECGDRSVPVGSLNVPKSTSGHFRRFKQLLRSFFEVEKKKDSLQGSNKCVLYGFYTNNVLVRP